MEILIMFCVVILVFACSNALSSGSEQDTYDNWKASKGTKADLAAYQSTIPSVESYSEWRQLQYNALITAPPVEEKPWVPIYSDCTPCDCGSCGTVKLQWLAFGVVLIAGIFGLHFMLV